MAYRKLFHIMYSITKLEKKASVKKSRYTMDSMLQVFVDRKNKPFKPNFRKLEKHENVNDVFESFKALFKLFFLFCDRTTLTSEL